jgi:NTP pyrophosphatase (non-canonical NTP hydrolase)
MEEEIDKILEDFYTNKINLLRARIELLLLCDINSSLLKEVKHIAFGSGSAQEKLEDIKQALNNKNNENNMELNSELDRLQKYSEIDRELKRAENKHPNFPDDMFQQLAIIQEEVGEVTKAVLHYHYENGSIDHIKEELIQSAAMCMRMLQNLPS